MNDSVETLLDSVAPAVVGECRETIGAANGTIPPYVAQAEYILANNLENDPVAMAELARLLPKEDGVPLETPWHLYAMTLLIEVLSYFWRARDDFFVGGDMFVYYSVQHVRKEDFL